MLYHDELVKRRRWLSADDFQNILTVAQVLPGPNLINVSAYLGSRLLSRSAAVAGVLCLSLPGAVLAILAASFVTLDDPDVRELLRGVAIGAFLLTGGFLWTLAKGLAAAHDGHPAPRRRRLARYGLALAVTALGLARVPVPLLVLAGVPAGLAVEFLR